MVQPSLIQWFSGFILSVNVVGLLLIVSSSKAPLFQLSTQVT